MKKSDKKEKEITELLNAVSIICYGKPKERWIAVIEDTNYAPEIRADAIARLKEIIRE